MNFLDNLFDAESLVDLVGLIGLNEGFDQFAFQIPYLVVFPSYIGHRFYVGDEFLLN